MSVAEWRKVWPTGRPEISNCPDFSPAASVIAYGLYGQADAAGAAAAHVADAPGDAQIDFTRWAITRWRELAGLDQPAQIDATEVDHALASVGA